MTTAPQTSTVEDEVAVIFAQHHADKRDVPAIAQYVRTKLAVEHRLELAEPLVFILDRIRSATAAGFWVDCLCIATQIDQRPGCCLRHIARAHVPASTVLARVNWWLESLNLPRPSHLATSPTLLEYVSRLPLKKWRRGIFTQEETQGDTATTNRAGSH